MTRSLRLRLVLWILALLVPVAAAAAWLLVEVFSNRLLRDLDIALQEEVSTVAALLEKPEGAVAMPTLLAHLASETDLGMGKFVVVRDREGIVAEAPPGAAARLQEHHALHRTAQAAIGPPDDPLTITVGVPTAASLRAPQRLTVLLAIGIPGLLLLLAVALWVVATRALRPLEQAAEAMDGIGVGDLTARIPSPTPDDELGRMVAALNRLLDRLAGGVTEMRRFTADAAHELRTPLAVLRTGLEVTLARERGAAEYRAALAEALRDTEHLARLAEDLLTLARLEALPPRAPSSPIGLAEMLQELADAWEEQATARGVGIDVAGEATLIVDGIAPELYRLFGNLIENALRHTPTGSRIEIAMRRDGPWARVCVIDGGSGLPPDQLERVFERFYRAPGSKVPGTGLGLSIARAIARAHHGDVRLWNHSRGGCVAEVSLPLGGTVEDAGGGAVSTSDS